MAFDMHIKFGKGKVEIKGASNHKVHKGDVPILAWSWGVSNTGDLHTGAGSASGGKANALLNACCTGARLENAWLYVTNATGEQTDFLTIELSEGVLVTSLSTGGSGGEDKLTENITLHFGKFKYSFQPQDDKGAKDGGTKDFTYDIQKVASA